MLSLIVDALLFVCKKQKRSLTFIKLCCPAHFNEFVYVPSVGASGGIIIIWDTSIFTEMAMNYETFALCVHFTSTQSAQSWTLVNVYGPILFSGSLI
jgi:hypothetical protein